jgi:hypothetical protein
MTVPDEAVEAAARVYELLLTTSDPEYVPDLRSDMRAALTAAAPFIAAQALVDAARDVAARGDIGRDGSISAWNYLNSRAELVRTNPYRSEERKTTFVRMDEPNPQWKELT